MSWFSLQSLRSKKFQHLGIFLFFSFVLLILPQREKLFISQTILQYTYSPFFKFSQKIKQLSNVYEENKKLQKENVRLILENLRLEEEGLENERLRALLDFKSQVDYNVIPGEVVALEPNRKSNSVLISVGKDDGVKKYLPVINMHGLVGKVTEVYPKNSLVELLSDPNCRIAALVKRSRVHGIVKQQKGKNLGLENVPSGADVRYGDEIISSGLGGVFPQALRIGTVVKTEDNKSSIFKWIQVQPYADFNCLEELFVIEVTKK
ncbi:MAG: rod shape-determining protein MreC [Candidatus Zixiibacteriota bacterium]